MQGLGVCTASDLQRPITVIADGSGGCFAFWQDRRAPAAAKVYGTRILSSAAVASGWMAGGRALCATAGNQVAPRAVLTSSGNAFVVWQDHRTGLDFELRGLGFTPAGSLVSGWDLEANLLAVTTGDDIEPRLAADATGGAYVLWKNTAASTSQLRLVRIQGSGQRAAGWPQEGLVIENAACFEHEVVADATGGALVAWGTIRAARARVFVQRVTASGARLWNATGVAVNANGENQLAAALAADGAGGALVTWVEVANGLSIRAQHIAASGDLAPGWSSAGRALEATESANPLLPALVTDADGCAIVSWFVTRPGTGSDLLATRLHPERGFTVDVSSLQSPRLAAWPNPFLAATTVQLLIPAAAVYEVHIYDVRGRKTRRLHHTYRAAGAWRITWDGRRDDGSIAPAGVYWMRARSDGFAATCKLMRAR
jgi:hypothetical protein